MTTIDSATAHAYIKQTEFASTPEIVFDRAEVEKALEKVSLTEGVATPSAKSYLDWARRYGVVERVEGSRGLYRWAPSMEERAVEVGRQITQEGVAVTDMDPENPMVLTDPEEDDLDLAEDHFDYREGMESEDFAEEFAALIDTLAESFEEMGDSVQRTADAIQAQAQAYPEDLHLIIDDVPRLPRKMKKRMKRDLIAHTSARKVTFSFAGADR